MHVGFEASCACRPVRTGVARYAIQLMSELAGGQDQLQGFVRMSRRFKQGYEPPEIAGMRWRYYVDRWKPGRLPELFHGLEMIVPAWTARTKAPRLVTVHDLFGVVVPELLEPRAAERLKGRYEEVARTATHVLTVSANTRTDFLERFDFDPERVMVTHLGVDERFHPRTEDEEAAVRQRLGIDGPFFLYVGDVTPRKNLARLIRAFGQSKAGKHHTLVLAGSIEDGMPEVEEALAQCEHPVKLLGFVSEDDLLALYSATEALLYPTLYEGFGLPILEAFASGTLALGADRGSVPEIAGGHGVLVDPTDVGAIADGIDKLATLGKAERDAARAHAATFTWSRCAEATREAYRVALGNPK